MWGVSKSQYVYILQMQNFSLQFLTVGLVLLLNKLYIHAWVNITSTGEHSPGPVLHQWGHRDDFEVLPGMYSIHPETKETHKQEIKCNKQTYVINNFKLCLASYQPRVVN